MRCAWGALVVAVAAVVAGCEANLSSGPAADLAAGQPAPPAPTPPGDPSAAAMAAAPASAGAAPAAASAPADDFAAPADDFAAPADAAPTDDFAAPESAPAANAGFDAATAEVAKAGVGAKGRNYGGPGLVTTPVAQYFSAQERIAFEAQVPKAMQLYKAGNDNKGPKTHEEFMNVIIKENAVKLPELPPGDAYLYDPKTEQLMVTHPAQAQ